MFAAALGVFFGFEVLDSNNFFAVRFLLSQLTHLSFWLRFYNVFAFSAIAFDALPAESTYG
jgi:hypothetical protein